MPTPARLEVAIDRIGRARIYTQQFLDNLTPEEYFWAPSGYTTHIAWQIAHVATSQYNLCLRRLRGRIAEDEAIISEQFVDMFKIGSAPVAGEKNNPPLEEIQRVFGAVHDRVLSELPLVDNAELDWPAEPPHPRFKTKLGAIEYSPLHEYVHAGQIAMLRRLMGKPAVR
jgi:DinB family protein